MGLRNLLNTKPKAKDVPKKTNGFFPWQKDKAAQKQETAAAFITEIMKHLPAIKDILKSDRSERPMDLSYQQGVLISNEADTPSDASGINVSPGAQRTAKMYDFYLDYTGTVQRADNFTISPMDSNYIQIGGSIGLVSGSDTQHENKSIKKDNRAQANPKDVLKELEQYPAPDMVVELEEKIATLKDKSLMTNQSYAAEQIKALIKRLENRRKYHEHEDFYKLFPNTNDEKIDNLLRKYKLVVKTIDIFVPTFPKEAIDVMKEYTRVTKAVCSEEPVYYVIAEESDFKEKFKKLDPILLVQSPFGFWWQVLGAWDKEMLLLCEL